MRYNFPVGKKFEDYQRILSDEFIVKRDVESGILIINYMFASPETFPDPMSFEDPIERERAAMRRECRGLKFSIETGEIVTRPFHKFFNIGEKDATQIGNIDWSQRHWILAKEDGSMITFHRSPNGTFEAHTKMGRTEVARPVEEFVKNSPVDYETFYDRMTAEGFTAIFEWVSRQQRIVLDYKQEDLILTAIRNIRTGEYVDYPTMASQAELFGIPVVKAYDSEIDDISEFVNNLYDKQDIEGYVFRFADGHMVKGKTKWYVSIHNTKDALGTEKNVWAMMLGETLDDLKPFMEPNDRSAVDLFQQDFDMAVERYARRLSERVEEARQRLDANKKAFAMEIAGEKYDKGMMFSIWDDKNPIEVVLNHLKKNVGSQPKIDAVRNIVGGLRWDRYYGGAVITDISGWDE